MTDRSFPSPRLWEGLRRYSNSILAAAALFAALIMISQVNFLFFHILVELFSIVIAITAFVLTWNARSFIQNGTIQLIGISFLFVAGFDLLHTLAYSGMEVFVGIGANPGTQLWLAARLTQAVSMVAAPLLLRRTIRLETQLFAYGVVCGFLLLSIYPWNIFPVSYDDGVGGGVTGFKIAAEFVVIGLLLVAGLLFVRIQKAFDTEVWLLILLSIAFTVISELFFTLYTTPFDFYNLTGHLLKIVAFYLVYRAIIDTGFRKPQEILYYELAQSEQALRASEAEERLHRAELEAIMDAVPASVWITKDRQSQVVIGNRQAVEFLRMKPAENLSLSAPSGQAPTHFIVTQNGRQLAPHELPLQATAASGKPLRDFEETIEFEDGTKVHLLGNVFPLLDEDGQPAGAVAAFMDITARKQADEAIREYAGQLERSNRELQEFAFVASHDMQEPLRKIQAFGGRLKAHLHGQLDAEAADYLERMANAAVRMRTMIDDLLSLSRITTHALPLKRIDLQEVVDEVVSDLEPRIFRAQGTVEVGDLPTIEADPSQMHQLFQNLIGNALKFHRDDAAPVVRVSSRRSPDKLAHQIFVEDNGIGFDEQYLERIFQPFQRLHGIGKYEGSGIGLAVCRKIVERHGGTITAASRPGQGSTFQVVLPVQQDKGTNITHEP